MKRLQKAQRSGTPDGPRLTGGTRAAQASVELPQLHVVHAADLSLTGPRRVLIAQRVASAHQATNRPNARFGAGTGDGRLVETRLDAPTKGVFNPAWRPGPVSRVPRQFGRNDRGLWAPFDPDDPDKHWPTWRTWGPTVRAGDRFRLIRDLSRAQLLAVRKAVAAVARLHARDVAVVEALFHQQPSQVLRPLRTRRAGPVLL
jgi:hypothetical protein